MAPVPQHRKLAVSLVKWIMFSLSISMLPFGARWLASTMAAKDGVAVSLLSVLGSGDLYLIACVCCAEAMGEALAGEVRDIAILIVGGSSMIVFSLALLMFSLSSVVSIFGVTPAKPTMVAKSSIALFAFAFALGAVARIKASD